ncbi:MAG: hypothetical protein COB50_00825 [Thiotrichales bacterium]|nr:MAG: hypothetical protein COB50_00825 [Thiotrichales bacterium]
MTANNNLSYGDYGYNQSGCSNNYSNFQTAAYSADPYSKINASGDGGLVHEQPFSSGNRFATDVWKSMWGSS